MPLVDLFNALSPSEEEMISIGQNETHVWYVAATSIPANTQILVSYGKYGRQSNAQLLMDYGFVFPNNDVGNSVFIPFRLLPSTEEYKEKLKLLRGFNLNKETNFPITLADILPNELLISYRILFLNSREVRRVVEQAIPLAEPLNDSNELKVRKRLLSIASNLLNPYTTGPKEDQELLEEDLSRRLRMAIQVRLEEKTILRRLIDRLEAEVVELELVHKNLL
jgi:hypothetical protein